MRFFQCDGCVGEKPGEPAVVLKGIILKGRPAPELDFCEAACFWAWVRSHDPKQKAGE